MLRPGNVMDNILTLGVLFGFFYLLYSNIKNPKLKEKIESFLKGGFND